MMTNYSWFSILKNLRKTIVNHPLGQILSVENISNSVFTVMITEQDKLNM